MADGCVVEDWMIWLQKKELKMENWKWGGGWKVRYNLICGLKIKAYCWWPMANGWWLFWEN